jgi:hypothetical protein
LKPSRYCKPILSDEEMLARSLLFEAMDSRRSTREFSDRPVPREVIENPQNSTAPSGAHKQPWTFAVENPEIKTNPHRRRRGRTAKL